MFDGLNRVTKFYYPLSLTFGSVFLISWFGLFLIIYLFGLSRDEILEHLPLFCVFKALTGIPCPGCGMTRGLLAVAGGDFLAAFSFNPLSIPLLMAIVFSAFKINFQVSPKVRRCLLTFFLFIILAWWFWMRVIPGL